MNSACSDALIARSTISAAPCNCATTSETSIRPPFSSDATRTGWPDASGWWMNSRSQSAPSCECACWYLVPERQIQPVWTLGRVALQPPSSKRETEQQVTWDCAQSMAAWLTRLGIDHGL